MMEELITAVKQVQSEKEAGLLETNSEKQLGEILDKFSDKNWQICQNFIVACLEKGYEQTANLAIKVIERRKLIDWKKHPDMVATIYRTLLEMFRNREPGHVAAKVMEKFNNQLKVNKSLKKYKEHLYTVIERAMTESNLPLGVAALPCSKEYPWKEDLPVSKKILQKIFEIVQKQPMLDEKNNCMQCSVITTTMLHIFIQSYNTPLCGKIIDEVVNIFNFCKDEDWYDPNDPENHTLTYQLLHRILQNYINLNSRPEILKRVIAGLKELWECGDEELEQDANNILSHIEDVNILGDDSTGKLIENYLSGAEPSLISRFAQMYGQCPERFDERLDEFIEAMDGGEHWVYLTSLNLFWQIAKEKPHVFSEANIKSIVAAMDVKQCDTLAIMTLQAIAEKKPRAIAPYDDQIILTMKRNKMMAPNGASTLVHLSVIDEKHGQKYLAFLAELMPSLETIYKTTLIYNMRSIGSQYPDSLSKYKQFFLELKKDAPLRDACQTTLDIIEGRSLEGVSQDVAEHKDELINLDERVTSTEDNVENVSREVDESKKHLRHLKTDVERQEGRLDDLQEVVDETVEKVEEIDHKTLSHAPDWSRDVAKLMNPEAEHDWRLLASRLGYTAEDIRNWATQPDPCLSLLDEWFATHKTREATYAVKKALEEIHRMDAANVVAKALESVEDIIDEEPPELINPPPIFISYQWGQQAEVKLLKKHLEMAGFESWVDIGQMGGGDKLYAKIDEGIRAAKVIICCVTDKYAESANCNKEVNLAVTLGKPIIPLLMQNMQWPPPGAMGPIFGEYLFVRFFKRPTETTNTGYFWHEAKFQELLMQLRYNIIPDDSLITEEYKDWWDPPEEEITIPAANQQKANETKELTSNEDKKTVGETPAIFISYQWGKQTQIKSLYRRLTAHGYTCWLDINQMGGGDSLYDKIDKGIRGCRLLLSCVSTKYSLSANCRREVSLADALKKPIVPLLLESMSWPPEGPMGMVFTQLLYIDFCKPNTDIQMNWKCPQFDELLGKVSVYVKKDDLNIRNLDSSQKTESKRNKDVSKTQPKPEETKADRSQNSSSKSSTCIIV